MLLALSLTASPMPAPAAEDAGDGTSFTLVLDGSDIDVTSAAAVVYPNPGGSPRVIPSEAFGFRNASLLIFGSDNRLTPNADCTRAQIAAILHRALGK